MQRPNLKPYKIMYFLLLNLSAVDSYHLPHSSSLLGPASTTDYLTLTCFGLVVTKMRKYIHNFTLFPFLYNQFYRGCCIT